MRRVFIEGYKSVIFTDPADGVVAWYDLWQYVAQENLTLIGATLTCDMDTFQQEDGRAQVMLRVVVNGVNAILHGTAYSIWKNVVAAQELGIWTNVHDSVMFPEGTGITIREGESVALNVETFSEKASLKDKWLLGLVLFFVKGL